jgi:hypothetical protein
MELSEEFPESAPWPKPDDQLFRQDGDCQSVARLKIGGESLYSYAIGYKKAGDSLAMRFLENWQGNEFLIIPMIFLYRQYLELHLKELLVSGRSSLGQAADFEDIHGLSKLWKPCQTILAEHWPHEPSETWGNVTNLIKEFDKLDGGSFAFRYPYTKKTQGRKITVPIDRLDVRNIYEVMQRLSAFFEAHSDGIDACRQ